MIVDPAFYLTAIPAVILVGFAKGGFAGLGLLAMPLMALTISPVQALAIMLPILMVQDVVTVWSYRRSWDPTNIVRLLPGAVIGIGIGYLLAAYVSEDAVALTIGMVAVSFALRRLVLERGGRIPQAAVAGRIGGAVWGAASGFTSMVAHAGGPPFQIYILPQRLHRRDRGGNGSDLLRHSECHQGGAILRPWGSSRPPTSPASLALFPLAVASTIAGIWAIRRIASQRFYTLIYILLVFVGGKLVYDGVSGILGLSHPLCAPYSSIAISAALPPAAAGIDRDRLLEPEARQIMWSARFRTGSGKPVAGRKAWTPTTAADHVAVGVDIADGEPLDHLLSPSPRCAYAGRA